jgi:hypothetical protein
LIYLFWPPLIPVAAALLLTHLVVPESPIRVPSRVNWAAACLMSVGLVLVLVATGMNTVTRTVGGAAAASVIAPTVVASTGFPTAHGYAHAFGLCAVTLLAGVLVGLAIPQRRPEAAFGAHAVGDPETVAAESP